MPDVLDRTVGLAARTRTLPDERAARRTLLDQIARLEHELSQLFCSTWPRTDMPRPAVAGRGGGPRLLSLGELEELRDDLAERVAGLPPGALGPHLGRGAEPPPDRGDAADAGALQVGSRVARGHRRARLPPLARAAALELYRDAHGLVASGHQLGLSVSHLKWVGEAASAVTRRAPSATPRGASVLAAQQSSGEPAPAPRPAVAPRAPQRALGQLPALRAGDLRSGSS